MSFFGQIYFINDGSQNFLIVQPIYNTFTTPAGLKDTIVEWKSKGLSNEKIKTPITANNSFSPKLVWTNNWKARVRFKRSCLKQNKLIFTGRYVVNLFIFYELDAWSQGLNTVFTIKDCFLELLN